MLALAELDMQLPIEVTDLRLLPHWNEADLVEHGADLRVAHHCRGCDALPTPSHSYCSDMMTVRAIRRSILNAQVSPQDVVAQLREAIRKRTDDGRQLVVWTGDVLTAFDQMRHEYLDLGLEFAGVDIDTRIALMKQLLEN